MIDGLKRSSMNQTSLYPCQLQSHFFAPPVKRWGLFPHSLRLGCTGDLLWPMESGRNGSWTSMLLLLKSHCRVRKSSLSHWVERPHGEKKRGHMEYEKTLGTRDHLDKHWATGHNHVEMSRPLWVLPKSPPTRLWEITWWVC